MKRRGSILIVSLLFISLLLILGMGFIASRTSEYKAARQSIQSLQAKSIAMAGLEETRAKLLKDFDFPPIAALDQPAYEVVEAVYDLDKNLLGSYIVTVETDRIGPPYYLLRINSLGLLGDRNQPLARRQIQALIDLRDPETNPDYFRIRGIQDLGSI